MAEHVIQPVSEADKAWALRRITSGLARKFGDRLQDGWSDATLESELSLCWTVNGGCYVPGKPHIEYLAAGLKVWVSWSFSMRGTKPTWQGSATIARVRELYTIPNPESDQLTLF